jgi:hypothetical protein
MARSFNGVLSPNLARSVWLWPSPRVARSHRMVLASLLARSADVEPSPSMGSLASWAPSRHWTRSRTLEHVGLPGSLIWNGADRCAWLARLAWRSPTKWLAPIIWYSPAGWLRSADRARSLNRAHSGVLVRGPLRWLARAPWYHRNHGLALPHGCTPGLRLALRPWCAQRNGLAQEAWCPHRPWARSPTRVHSGTTGSLKNIGAVTTSGSALDSGCSLGT